MSFAEHMNPALEKDSEWHRIADAPFDRDLELAVIDYSGVHALVFPCRRLLHGFIKAQNRALIDVEPTHWRYWPS